MTDNLTPEDRRKTMRAVKGKSTGLERRLFSIIAGMGLRGWKKNVSEIPGKPDVVFWKERILIFVDGCFWHGCPYCNRKLPQTNREYWNQKIKRNAERDRMNTENLRCSGWEVIRIWEHEIGDSLARAEIRPKIQQALGKEVMNKKGRK